MSTLRFETPIEITSSYSTKNFELKLVILYSVTPARAATALEPGHGDTVEVHSVRAINEHHVEALLTHAQIDWAERAHEEAMLSHWRESRVRAPDAADARRGERLRLVRS